MRLLIASVLLCLGFAVNAQTVPGSVDLAWELPTTGCTSGISPCDNAPLTGPDALTAINVYISTSPIPDNTAMAPTLALGAVTTVKHTMQVKDGDTIYARVRAVNSSGPSVFSGQVSKVIKLPVVPGVPTNVTITLTIG
jgi:predicted phage tail protein